MPAEVSRDRRAAAEPWGGGPLRHPPGRRPAARAHERAARRGRCAVRHRAGDGGHAPGVAAVRCGHRHRGERHRQPCDPGGHKQPDLWHARHRGLEVQDLHRAEAVHGYGVQRSGQPAVLPRERADAVRRCEELSRCGAPLAGGEPGLHRGRHGRFRSRRVRHEVLAPSGGLPCGLQGRRRDPGAAAWRAPREHLPGRRPRAAAHGLLHPPRGGRGAARRLRG
mmetsp:Transcript_30308/g.87390  ORF Transcript_30308/g.87390 Transcript_30308/m.87390 type:complete len:223 (+) Transcript_30308:1662-2330(+)